MDYELLLAHRYDFGVVELLGEVVDGRQWLHIDGDVVRVIAHSIHRYLS